MVNFNWIDITVLLIWLLLIGLGAWSGLIRSLFHISAWIAGLVGAWFLDSALSPLLILNIQNVPPLALKILSWLIGFIVLFLLVRIAGNRLHKWISQSPLNSVNRLGGAGVGALKAALITLLFLMIFQVLPLQGDWLEQRNQALVFKIWQQIGWQPDWKAPDLDLQPQPAPPPPSQQFNWPLDTL